jgi:hypothetical protein
MFEISRRKSALIYPPQRRQPVVMAISSLRKLTGTGVSVIYFPCFTVRKTYRQTGCQPVVMSVESVREEIAAKRTE